jgi:hypothetical protein
MIDFSETLPVGMVAHGGQVAQAMALAAQKIHNILNWEAFHYERMSENSFELTGGIVSNSNGAKRWLEPHDSFIISHTQIIEAYAILFPEEIQLAPITVKKEVATNTNNPTMPTLQNEDLLLQLTLKLPKDEAERKKILQACHLYADFQGATIIACQLKN